MDTHVTEKFRGERGLEEHVKVNETKTDYLNDEKEKTIKTMVCIVVRR